MDNMHERSLSGTVGWTAAEIVPPVPARATRLAFGVILVGDGAVDATGLGFGPADPDTPVTTNRLPEEPLNLDFSMAAVGGEQAAAGRGAPEATDTADEAAVSRPGPHQRLWARSGPKSRTGPGPQPADVSAGKRGYRLGWTRLAVSIRIGRMGRPATASRSRFRCP